MLRTRLIAGPVSGIVLSSVMATALTLVSFGETFIEPWRVDPAFPAPINLRLPRTTLLAAELKTGAAFATRSAIVRRGETVADPTFAALIRIYERTRRPPSPSHLAAYWLVHFLGLMIVTAYLRRGAASHGRLLRAQVGLTALAMSFVLLGKVLLLFTPLSAQLLPIALIPLWASRFFGRRTAMLMSGVMTLLCASLVAYDPIVIITFFASCVAGSGYVRERRRKQSAVLLLAGAVAGVAGLGVYLATKELFDSLSLGDELQVSLQVGASAVFASGLCAGLLAWLLQPVVSRLLGVLSQGQLLALTDLEQPLLQKMAAEAPGSWEHSRAMANLAEAAASAIHADALLTRAGAYYHDLGKSCQPKYYVENLAAGERSPHEDLAPHISADAIMAHVIEGVRILREGGVPESVIEFAYTHHGTSLIEYFWHKCLQQGNPKGLTQDAFCYPGMRPRTKETAILMLIDSIEAGARTVEPPTHAGFEQLVQRVIFSKLRQGQLDASGLTLHDLRVLSSQISDTLVNIRHKRIRYPWQEDEAAMTTSATEQTDRSTPGTVESPPAQVQRQSTT